jgi:hypothetical protein
MLAILQSGALTQSVSRGARSFPPSNGNPTQPGAAALPGHEQPLPPRTRDRRRRAHEAAPSRHEVGSAARHGRANMGQMQRAGAKATGRSIGDASRLRSGIGRAALSRRRDAGGGAPRTRRTRTSRSKATASIHDCEPSRRTRHVSMNPLGFVTLSPTGRPGNRSSRRFSPSPFGRIPRETKSPASAVLRSAPADAWRRCSAGFRTGFLSVTEGNTLT